MVGTQYVLLLILRKDSVCTESVRRSLWCQLAIAYPNVRGWGRLPCASDPWGRACNNYPRGESFTGNNHFSIRLWGRERRTIITGIDERSCSGRRRFSATRILEKLEVER